MEGSGRHLMKDTILPFALERNVSEVISLKSIVISPPTPNLRHVKHLDEVKQPTIFIYCIFVFFVHSKCPTHSNFFHVCTLAMVK